MAKPHPCTARRWAPAAGIFLRNAVGGGIVVAALSVLGAGWAGETRTLGPPAGQAAPVGERFAQVDTTARLAPASTPRRTLVAVVHVRFRFGGADLDAAAEAALAAIVQELRDDPALTVDLDGTTDPVGTVDYNVRLSQRRVEAVQRWLLTNGVSPSRIVGSAGRGPLLDTSVEDDAKRRVAVKLMAPE